MMQNRKFFLFIGIISLFLIILMGIIYFSTGSYTPIKPTPSPEPKASFFQALDKDYQRIKNKKPLSDSDAKIRDKLISSAGKKGLIYQGPKFKISYFHSPDDFDVEIQDKNIDQAKQEALNWFKEKGVSMGGICSFPVVFLISPQVLQAITAEN